MPLRSGRPLFMVRGLQILQTALGQGYSRQPVARLAEEGSIRGHKMSKGGRWWIETESVLQYIIKVLNERPACIHVSVDPQRIPLDGISRGNSVASMGDNRAMPAKSQPKERPIIEMLLSAYEDDTWRGAFLDWIEERADSAVEVIATRPDGVTLALEHTLIQPFVGEKLDSEAFMRAFGRIEMNSALVMPGRSLDVVIPVHAIPKGYDWNEVGLGLLTWLIANHAGTPMDSETKCAVPVGHGKSGPLKVNVTLRTTSLPGMPGNCLISRNAMPTDLTAVVEKALQTKIPKLVKTVVHKRLLLLERDQCGLGEGEIYREIVRLAPRFPDLAKIDEIWFANTSTLELGWAYFKLMDGRGSVEFLDFCNGVLKKRRNDRALLGPGWREF